MEELAVVYLREVDTKDIVDTSDSSKCGEVFRSTSGRYTLSCSHCNLSFLCLTEFSEHIEEHFQLISIATLNDPNGELETEQFKNTLPIPSDTKEEQTELSEIKVEMNDNHLVRKKRARKKVDHTDGDNDCLPKATKSKGNKPSKVSKEPTNNIWICDICGKM